MRHHGKRSRTAFTLVELLVVIGIIALLIAILLPALNKARSAAKTIACGANIRSILQAMQMYAAQNNGSIPGSPWTTSRFLFKDVGANSLASGYNDTNCPSVVHYFDWASPLAKIMGIKFEEGPTQANRVTRFTTLRDFPGFHCPENDFLQPPYTTGPSFPVGVMCSYITSIPFLVRHTTALPKDHGGAGGYTLAFPEWNVPLTYNITISKIGDGSQKVYIADGGKYTDAAGDGPDAQLTFNGQLGGPYSDQPPCETFTTSWDRGWPGLTGNTSGHSGTKDPRIFAYRHGVHRQFAAADEYRMNLGFFDGHVETQGDLQSSNPKYWFPKGTALDTSPSELQTDTQKRFLNGVTGTYIVP